MTYRKVKHSGDELEAWAIAGEIEEIEREISEAHRVYKGRMTAARNSGHPVIQFENIISPMVPQWSHEEKREIEYESNWNCTQSR